MGGTGGGSMEDIVNAIMEEQEEYERQQSMEMDDDLCEDVKPNVGTNNSMEVKQETMDSPPRLTSSRGLLSPEEIKKEPLLNHPTPKSQRGSESKNKSSSTSSSNRAGTSKETRVSPKVELPTSPSLDGSKLKKIVIDEDDNSNSATLSRPSLLDEPSEFGARSGSPFGDE